MPDVTIRCACGSLQGVATGLSSRTGNRVVCYCDDCQAFPRFLGRAGDVLDPHGGTDIFQTSPARISIQAGADHLACMRLSSRGMLRWFASCCNTPIGNTMPFYQVPFVGLIHSCTALETGAARDDALGLVRAYAHPRFAKGDDAPRDASPQAPARLLLRILPMIAMARLRGDHKRSPFFDPETGKPTVRARVLSETERTEIS